MKKGLFSLLSASAMVVSIGAKAQAPDIPTELNVIYEINPGSRDYMSSNSLSEVSSYPLLGPIFYLLSNNLSGTVPLYRELYSSVPDHMDSTISQEGGYQNELILGWPWSSSTAYPGISSIKRYLKGSDHGTFTTPVAGYNPDAVFQAYGYARYQNNSPVTASISGGGLTLTSDEIAGGAVSSLIWNSTQFVDSSGYGRYLQADYFDGGAMDLSCIILSKQVTKQPEPGH